MRERRKQTVMDKRKNKLKEAFCVFSVCLIRFVGFCMGFSEACGGYVEEERST